MGFSSYEEAIAQHEWRVPERYNIAADVCDKHDARQARDDPRALRRRGPRGPLGRAAGGLQPLRARAARARRREGRPRRDAAPAHAGDGGGVLRARSSAGRSCSRCRCSTATRASATGSRDSAAKVLVTDAANAGRIDPALVEHILLIEDLPAGGDDGFDAGGHAGRRPGPALLLVGHDRPRQGDPARAPLPARARGVRLLPRGAGGRALPRHGRVGVGRGHRAAVRAVAARRGPARLPARGRLRPPQAARRAQRARRHERLHDAHGDALDDGSPTRARATRRSFRRVCSAGEPLNPEAIRWFREQFGITVLDYYGLTESYPLVANYPFMEVREGSMGRPMPGWDVQILDEDERPVPTGERGEICLRARSNPHYPLGYWRTTRSPRRRSAASGSTRRTRRASTRTATSGTRAAPTT